MTHAGQNALAEVAAARQPAIIVAQPRPHAEQLETARTLDDAGIATGLTRWPAPEHLPRLLEAAAARGGDGWRSWSMGDGALRAARLLDRLAESAHETEDNAPCARY
jgi:predicted glycosyltransferase